MPEDRTQTRCRSTSAPKVSTSLVSLESLCRARREPLEHVRALIRARRLPQPVEVTPDGTELVRRDYFRLVDAAGSIGALERYFRESYAPALSERAGRPTDARFESAWFRYLDGATKIDTGVLDDPLSIEPERGTWPWHVWRELRRFRDGQRRLAGADGPELERRREQQLMRIGSAAWGAGLSLLMLEREAEARSWLDCSALCYRRCLADAEPGAWGRSIGAMKARLIAGDPAGAVREAHWTLDLDPERTDSVTAMYAACLAHLTLGEDESAASLAATLMQDTAFPPATAQACMALATGDNASYPQHIRDVLRTFEQRHRFLEDVPMADTVLALQALAAPRGLALGLKSTHLPRRTSTTSGIAG